MISRGLVFFFCLIYCGFSYSQGAVGIGTNLPADESAILDVVSDNKGVLLPRINGRSQIATPVNGLMIYNTSNSSYEYYDGSNWIQLVANPVKDIINMDTSSINMSNNKITNLSDGTDNGDAVNFGQMDAAVIPPGGIIMWSGTTLPDGWALCNGNNGTPDLRNRFILGANAINNYPEGGTETSSTTTITYFEEDLYTTDPSNCSSNQYRFSFTLECETPEGEIMEFDHSNIEANTCYEAVGRVDPSRECGLKGGSCTSQSNNPNYYIGNSNCETGAIERNVVTDTDNEPQFYQLAFIMKL